MSVSVAPQWVDRWSFAGRVPDERKASMTTEAGPGQMPAAQVPADAFLVDVREPDEWTAGHAPGAMHIPLGQLGARYTEIPQDGQENVIRSDEPTSELRA